MVYNTFDFLCERRDCMNDIKIGDKVTFNINPKFVDSRVRRDYR